ncbi:MAG: type VI secretion system Vgr family protein [Polyangiales bacterium]
MATRTFEAIFKTSQLEAIQVVSLHLHQRMGKPSDAMVEALFDDAIDPEEMLGKDGTAGFAYEGAEPVVLQGVVMSVSMIGSTGEEGAPTRYRIHLADRTAILQLDYGCEIFQELTVKEIIAKVLEDHGIASDGVQWKLSETHPKRTYCVRYEESSFDFIARLCEEEGIYFYSELPSGQESAVLVFADDSSAAPPITGDSSLPYRRREGFDQRDDVITEIAQQRRVVPGKVVLRDYNFEKPALDLTSTVESDVETDLELYDFPGCYETPADGKFLARVRLEAEQAARRTVTIESDCTRVQIGHLLTIVDAEELGETGEYLVTEAEHILREAGLDGGGGYHSRARLLTKSAKYRLPQVTPKPRIEGPQTAKIVAPDGSPDQEIHTDKHGRAKVKFHWDLGPETNDKASCWMRVGQLQSSGSMYLPRIGWEVVVQFLEGDPDRPVVTGKLYNGALMPPYKLPEGRTRTAIQSLSTPGGGGMNEIRLEDKAGGEEIAISAQYDTNIVAANNKTKNVGNNETQSVGVNASTKVGANQTVKITQGFQRTIGADQTVTVGGNRKVEVNAVSGRTAGGSSTTTVGANHFEMVGNPLEGLIQVAAEKAVAAAAAEAMAAAQGAAGAAMAKVQQSIGPVMQAASQAQAMGQGMQAVANGNLGAAAGVLGSAAGMPGAGAMAASMSASGSQQHGGADPNRPTGAINAAHTVGEAMVGEAIRPSPSKGARKQAQELSAAAGGGGGAGGGASAANQGGPEGAVAGVSGGDKEKGPGHIIQQVGAAFTETVGALKLVVAANDVMTNVAGAMTQSIGAAKVDLVLGDHSEANGATKTETEIGMVSVVKGDETESAGAMKTEMVGGAVLEKIGGNHTIVAGAMASFIGAFHKIDAKGKITFKCGASSVVVDGSGVTITSPMVQIMAAKIEIPKSTTEL